MESERFVTIPSALEEELLKNLSPAILYPLGKLTREAAATVDELEILANAFFFIEPMSWMGVVQQPNYENLQRETPQAVRAAIKKLGSITLYWQAYAKEAKVGRLSNVPDSNRHVLEIDPQKSIRII